MNRTALIVRLPNRLGDTIPALPALKALVEVGFSLELYGNRWIHQLPMAFPTQALRTLPNTLRNTIAEFKKNPTRPMLLLTNSFGTALTGYLAGKAVLGYRGDYRNCLLRYKITRNESIPISQYFWQIAAMAQKIWRPQSNWPQSIPQRYPIAVDEKTEALIGSVLQPFTQQKPYVVLNPCFSGILQNDTYRVWPGWAALFDELAHQGKQCIICPGPGEVSFCKELLPRAIIIENIDLGGLLAVFKHAEYVISNDSGPMHLAATVNPNVLGIFGQSNIHKFSPLGGHAIGDCNQWPSVESVLKKIQHFT